VSIDNRSDDGVFHDEPALPPVPEDLEPEFGLSGVRQQQPGEGGLV
jgi:hypothetical protein